MFEEDSIFREIYLPVIGVLVFITIPFIIIGYFSSCKSAEIYNKKNNTDYTCSDFFWASEQINSSTQTIKIK